MLTQEALQEQKIVEIVDEIKKRPHTKFIMIAGPSSSGKTTFSHRLSIQLMANGYKPHQLLSIITLLKESRHLLMRMVITIMKTFMQ